MEKNNWFNRMKDSLNNYFGEGSFNADDTEAEVEQKIEDLAAEKGNAPGVTEAVENIAQSTEDAVPQAVETNKDQEEKIAQLEAKIDSMQAAHAEQIEGVTSALADIQKVVAEGFTKVGSAMNTVAQSVKLSEQSTNEKIVSLANRINDLSTTKSGANTTVVDRFEHGEKNNAAAPAKEGQASYTKKEDGSVIMFGGSALDSLLD